MKMNFKYKPNQNRSRSDYYSTSVKICINCGILVQKMHCYSIRVENWTQKVGNTYSNHSDKYCGKPQRSLQGPVLLLLYLNDLPTIHVETFHYLKMITTILWPGESPQNLKQIVCSDLSKVRDGCDSNFLFYYRENQN